MGWASGSYMAEALWDSIEHFIIEEHKQEVARIVYEEFNSRDADDWNPFSDLLLTKDGITKQERLKEYE